MNSSIAFLYRMIREENSYIDKHLHASFELVYYLNGCGSTRVGDSSYSYSAHTYALIPPHTPHDELRIEATEVLFIGFHTDNSELALTQGLYHDTNRRSLVRILELMHEELELKLPYYTKTVDLLLQQLIIELSRQTSEQPKLTEPDTSIAYAKSYMEHYYNQPLDGRTLAKLAGYSYDHFRHLFKLHTGYSPKAYIMELRLEKAKQLLLQSQETITAIADSCGYGNVQQFCMLFKRSTGVTPAAYRR
ncbi:helix-turn-helix domain-containing protein [Paenibacillus sp. GCM10023252]|uniref:helix-turn-helix domain-containing protein n=1 Tax=Paenibacillus sp. GCM10023252 TaxID=3252649 RepID=UPI003606C777